MDNFVFFLWICHGETATAIFSQTATNIASEILFYLAQVMGFWVTFLRLLVVRVGGVEKMDSKVD